jgi:hypothetical protein
MASAQDIRELVLSYISGEISASDFANRFNPVFHAAIKSNDNSVKDLAFVVHAQISHYFHSLISESIFRENLAISARDISVHINKPFLVDPKFTFRKKDEPSSGHVEVELEYA